MFIKISKVTHSNKRKQQQKPTKIPIRKKRTPGPQFKRGRNHGQTDWWTDRQTDRQTSTEWNFSQEKMKLTTRRAANGVERRREWLQLHAPHFIHPIHLSVRPSIHNERMPLQQTAFCSSTIHRFREVKNEVRKGGLWTLIKEQIQGVLN